MAARSPLLQRFQLVGADTSVYFRFERLPFPDVDPSFNLDPVVIVGEAEHGIHRTIPAQAAANTYSSFLMYVVEQDSPVIVKDIVVTDDGGSYRWYYRWWFY